MSRVALSLVLSATTAAALAGPAVAAPAWSPLTPAFVVATVS